MQIVEQHHQRPIDREQLQQHPDRTVSAVALVGDRTDGRSGCTLEGREDLRELGDRLGVPCDLQAQFLRGDMCVEGVDPDAERQIALEFRRRTREDEPAAFLGAIAQLGQQTRLADAGLALDRHADRALVGNGVQCPLEQLELRLAPDCLAGRLRDLSGRHRLVGVLPL